MHTATIIDAKRVDNARRSGPAIICQRLVTSDGTTSNVAACNGAITAPSKPIATIGKPMPTTPFTHPASRNVLVTTPMTYVVSSMAARRASRC